MCEYTYIYFHYMHVIHVIHARMYTCICALSRRMCSGHIRKNTLNQCMEIKSSLPKYITSTRP